MAGEEVQLIPPVVQWIAGGSFAVWAVSSFVSIATKIRGNGKVQLPIPRVEKWSEDPMLQGHMTDGHDTNETVKRLEVKQDEVVRQLATANGYLKRIAENGSK